MDKAGRPTAATQLQGRIPDFFIVGHPKCGTTALYEMLRQHPQIYMPDDKEPNFFNNHGQRADGPKGTFNDYLSLFDAASPEQRVGEASVFYLSSRNAASAIAHMQPAARIIAIFREPASFLYSLHLQFIQSDFEAEKDFRKALSLENVRRESRYIASSLSHWHERLFYSDHVRYVEQLRRYDALFPPEQVLVLIYDDFRRDNEATIRKVLDFINVDCMPAIGAIEMNPTVRIRSMRLNRIIFREQGAIWKATRGAMRPLVNPQTRRRLLETFRDRVGDRVVYGSPRPPDEGFMMELRRRFKPEVVALSEYLDRDLVQLWGYDSID